MGRGGTLYLDLSLILRCLLTRGYLYPSLYSSLITTRQAKKEFDLGGNWVQLYLKDTQKW